MVESSRAAHALLSVVVALALILALIVGYRAGHREDRVYLHPCAAVLTRGNEMVCR